MWAYLQRLDATLKFYTDQMGIKKADISDMTMPGMMRLATIKLPGANLELVQYLNEKEVLAKYARSQVGRYSSCGHLCG